ncbi:hypothetical protein CNBG_1595 [Cryptococcus deuterogattii R265]|uniref:uncharacterized protein n=1 Tax=Cryptococcus deuterogattii (strain R265) TaxID=294750 RepID=UPI001936240E|nr:hypothetical protein CNBG_1595 [Cryptococcus deuterogattii R265]
MVYAPQRRHAMASLTSTAQILAYLQYLYSPSLLVLLARLLTHIQIQVISLIPPSRSLQNLATMLTLVNIVAGVLHWLDSGPAGGGGMILDFVGTRPRGLAWVWGLDVMIWGIHLLALVLSYINSIAGTHDYKKSAKFPYPDILLPPPSQSTQTRLLFPFPFSFPFHLSSTSSKYGVISEDDEQEQDDLELGQQQSEPSTTTDRWGASTPTSTSNSNSNSFPSPPPHPSHPTGQIHLLSFTSLFPIYGLSSGIYRHQVQREWWKLGHRLRHLEERRVARLGARRQPIGGVWVR